MIILLIVISNLKYFLSNSSIRLSAIFYFYIHERFNFHIFNEITLYVLNYHSKVINKVPTY